MTLTDFLLARIAEDEANGPWHADWCSEVVSDAWSCDCPGPARLLVECAAKRRIVELHEPEEGDYGPGCFICNDTNYVDGARLSSGWPCDTLRAIALPYADHPDYRDEWKAPTDAL